MQPLVLLLYRESVTPAAAPHRDEPDALADLSPAPASGGAAALKLSEIVSALSYALDITEGQPEGHVSPASRVLAVADQFEALSAARPYREKLSREAALEILRQSVGTGICPEAFAALTTFSGYLPDL